MKMAAAEFKAKCLSVLDSRPRARESVTITKRGRVVARVVPAGETDERPWLRLGHTARWEGDPLAPAVEESEAEALR